ncbi:TonB-dependent receptor [Pedobacter gandavensis]|uniref:TonB-dependent receptor n=1 Tax=Pedobacter gandavensis TaxID=2679963 RepID=UPI00292EA615|nr:TonB-dependent receptor [Pedobacter gandavensis]
MKVMLYFLIKKYFNQFTSLTFRSRIVLAVLMMFGLSGQVRAQNSTQNRISIQLKGVLMPKAMSEIATKSACVINYNPAIFKADQRVSIDVKDKLPTEIIKTLLEGTGLSYKITDAKTILLFKQPAPVKPGKITGKIVDEKGEPLPGAGIKIIELNRAASTDVDGSFTMVVDPGNYTLEIRYVSYQTRRLTDVLVKSGESAPVNISMKPASSTLTGVVITGGYKKDSDEGLLVRQKNAAELSNGISAEQISKTPDANLGEVLKRVTGITTVDNKYVVVRGMGERYNSATLDGTVLPSTEVGRRAFAFDLIPSNLIDNVTVSKTITPDMNTTFAGGLIQINTKDIPDADFNSFSIGYGANTQSLGKDFYSPKHGKYDYLGFDDGRRDFPKDLRYTTELLSNRPDKPRAEDKFAQSRLFTKDNITLYKYKAPIAQNYQFTIGRAINLDTNKVLGIVGSLSYRNTQNITEVSDFNRGTYLLDGGNHGNMYNFNTTLGAILNMGLKLKDHRISFRNTYTRKFESNTSIINNYLDNQGDNLKEGIPQNQRIEVNPTFLDLLMNKLGMQHQLGKVKVEWELARTGITRNQKDVIRRDLYPQLIDGTYQLVNITNSTQTGDFPISRHHYLNKEEDYNWNVSGSLPFNLLNTKGVLKSGYAGVKKHLKLNWEGAQLNHIYQVTSDSLLSLPLSEKIKPENLNPKGFVWEVQPWLIDFYEGKSIQHAGYLMLDNRFTEQLRLVWGVRAEYYKYTELNNPSNAIGYTTDTAPHDVPDAKWRWLPSANFTYSPTQKINLRMAYSRTMIRPEFLERTRFQMYNPDLNAYVYSMNGLTSTRVDGFDFRAELFPGLGETLSVGAFYRYFDKPVEMNRENAQDSRINYVIRNAINAKNYGLELEFRKKLDFIMDKTWLSNLTVFGNATYIKSEVTQAAVQQLTGPEVLPSKAKRPLYGQTPYLINAGLQYSAQHLVMNVVYNKTGRKLYLVSAMMLSNEYQRPYSQLDAQLSYKFLKPRIELKFNAGNLLNEKIQFYNNGASYRQATPEDNIPLSNTDQFVLKPGFTDDYEKGDNITFTQRIGRTFSFQLTYDF